MSRYVVKKPIYDERSQDVTAGAMLWLQEQDVAAGLYMWLLDKLLNFSLSFVVISYIFRFTVFWSRFTWCSFCKKPILYFSTLQCRSRLAWAKYAWLNEGEMAVCPPTSTYVHFYKPSNLVKLPENTHSLLFQIVAPRAQDEQLACAWEMHCHPLGWD